MRLWQVMVIAALVVYKLIAIKIKFPGTKMIFMSRAEVVLLDFRCVVRSVIMATVVNNFHNCVYTNSAPHYFVGYAHKPA